MISRYSQIQQQVTALAASLSRPGHVQKMYSTSRYLCIQIRVGGKNLSLYLGRGGGHEGMWLGDKIPSSFLRLRDRWLEWCRKNFSSSLLLAVTMDPLDRGVAFEMQKGGERQTFHVAWLGRNCYFACFDHATNKWFTSWKGSFEGVAGFEIFDEIGRKAFNDVSPPAPLTLIENLLKEEDVYARKGAVPKQKLKSLRTKISRIKEDLARIAQWEDFQNWLSSLDPTSLEPLEKIQHGDLTYKFPKGLSTWQKRDWAFGQIKRLRSVESLQQGRLRESEQLLSEMETGKEITENPLRPQGPVWKNVSPSKPTISTNEGEYTVHVLEGFKVCVGASAQGNDQMRKLWAKSEDWWLHASAGPSAHAIIKLPQEGTPSPDQLMIAARLLAKRSRISATELEIITTQVKNVRGVTGKPGMVTYKKLKILLCDLSDGVTE
jgi:hypothetical protein